MSNEKLFKFCFFLYRLRKRNLFIFLNSLSLNCLVFVLSELIFFGFFITRFFFKINLARLTNTEIKFYGRLLKKGFIFTQKRSFLRKRIVFFKKYSSSNFFFKFGINKTKNFKKDLLVNLLGRTPVIGLYERREYIKKYGYNQNYNSKKRSVVSEIFNNKNKFKKR